jgi:hypothetical protein
MLARKTHTERKKQKYWVHGWINRREVLGASHTMLKEVLVPRFL